MTTLQLIQKKLDETLHPKLATLTTDWNDVLQKIPLDQQSSFIKKLETLTVVFIKTQFYNQLTTQPSYEGIYDADKDVLHLNQKTEYQAISLAILTDIRQITRTT